MAGFSDSTYVDLITTTLKDMGKLKWTDMSYDLNEHIALSQILNKKKVGFTGGTGIQWNMKVSGGNSAKNVGLGAQDSVNIQDYMTTAEIDWRHTTANYGWERRVLAMNRKDPEKLVDLIEVARYDCMCDIAGLAEGNFWGKPENSADKFTPYGLFYWLVGNATEGFYGQCPAGFTDVAGLDPVTAYPRHRNWTFEWVEVSKTDLIRKMRRAVKYTAMKPPAPGSKPYTMGKGKSIYSVYNVIRNFEERLEEQGDNMGNDLAPKDGAVMFRGIPVQWAPALDANDQYTDPVVGIDWSVFRPVFLKGEYMREDGPEKVSGQHTMFVVFIDCTYNFVCYNRRKLWIGTNSGTALS